MTRLDGKTPLVTGGSHGIGRATAERLASDGAFVMIHYGHDDDAAADTLASIERSGGSATTIRASLGEKGALDVLFSGLAAALAGRALGILVNNVGIGGQSGCIEEVTNEQFDRLFDVNVKAPLFIIQRARPLLSHGGADHQHLFGGYPNCAACGADIRHDEGRAQRAQSDARRHTLGRRGITVNAVAPGVTDTGKLGSLNAQPALKAATEAVTALGRIGEPADIADIVAFLASPDARWITGQIIDASGGTFLGPTGLRNLSGGSPGARY